MGIATVNRWRSRERLTDGHRPYLGQATLLQIYELCLLEWVPRSTSVILWRLRMCCKISNQVLVPPESRVAFLIKSQDMRKIHQVKPPTHAAHAPQWMRCNLVDVSFLSGYHSTSSKAVATIWLQLIDWTDRTVLSIQSSLFAQWEREWMVWYWWQSTTPKFRSCWTLVSKPHSPKWMDVWWDTEEYNDYHQPQNHDLYSPLRTEKQNGARIEAIIVQAIMVNSFVRAVAYLSLWLFHILSSSGQGVSVRCWKKSGLGIRTNLINSSIYRCWTASISSAVGLSICVTWIGRPTIQIQASIYLFQWNENDEQPTNWNDWMSIWHYSHIIYSRARSVRDHAKWSSHTYN